MAANPAPNGTDYERGFERCVVTFIDILGYRNLLNSMQAEELVGVVNALRSFAAGDGDGDDADGSHFVDCLRAAGLANSMLALPGTLSSYDDTRD